MPTTAASVRRARRVVWLARHVPRPLRHPRRAAQVGLGSAALWFAALFVALGLAGTGSGPVTVAFLAAGASGVLGAGLVGARRIESGAWSVGVMLVIGQAAAFSLAW